MNHDFVAMTVAMVKAWEPDDLDGYEHKAATLDVLTLNSPFSRDADPRHVTTSAVVLSSAGVLVHKHKLSGLWFGPGGHIDPGESPWDAVLRETYEETGIIAQHPPSGPLLVDVSFPHPTTNHHVHHDLRFLLPASPTPPRPGPGESPHVGWYPPEEALALVDESWRRGLVRALGIDVGSLR